MTEVMAAYGDGIAAAAGASGSRAIHVYPVSNYTFGSKASKPDKDATVAEAMIRLKDKYEREGMRRTVEAILLVNQHDHPHVLLLQRTMPGGGVEYKLPGGRLRHGEGEVAGLGGVAAADGVEGVGGLGRARGAAARLAAAAAFL